MQRDIEISPREEIDLGEINKGVELLMMGTNPPDENLIWRKKMEAALITIGVCTGILALFVGGILGYILRTYIQTTIAKHIHIIQRCLMLMVN